MLEMMIVLIIIGALLGVGVPAFNEALERRRIDGIVDELQAQIALAKSEAIKRNVEVSVAFTRTGDATWCMGIDEDDTAGCNCTTANDCTVDGLEKVLSITSADRLDLPAAPEFNGGIGDGGDNGFVFDPATGALTDLNDNGNVEIETEEGNFRLRMTVSPLGLTSVCYLDTYKPVGGYDQCPSP